MDKEFKIFVAEVVTKSGGKKEFVTTEEKKFIQIASLLEEAGVTFKKYVIETNPLQVEEIK